jgi:hypothetical protein
MNSQRRVTWCVATMLALFAGLGSFLHAKPDRPEDKKTPNYYPLNVGNQWTYKVSVAENSANVQSRIVKMENIDNHDLARLEATVNNSIVAVEHLRQTEQGIFRYRNNGIDINPPLLLLKYPVNIKSKEPMKWSGALKGGSEKGTYTAEATEESVEVPFGKYQAIRVVIKLEQGKGPGQTVNTTYWFVKDIGFVKQTVEAGGLSILMELEKFDRAKDSQ